MAANTEATATVDEPGLLPDDPMKGVPEDDVPDLISADRDWVIDALNWTADRWQEQSDEGADSYYEGPARTVRLESAKIDTPGDTPSERWFELLAEALTYYRQHNHPDADDRGTPATGSV